MEKIHTYLTKHWKHLFFRNVVVIASGTAAVQVIGIIFSPIITRIYGPEAFGLVGIFISIINVVGPVAAFSLPTAIVLPEKTKEAINLVKLSFGVTIIFTLLFALFLYIGGSSLLELMNAQAITPFLFLLPIIVILISTIEIFDKWLIRTKQFKIKTGIKVINSLSANLMKIVFGLFIPSGVTLIVVLFISKIFHILLQIFGLTKSNKVFILKKNDQIAFKQAFKLLKKYHHFPVYQTPQVILSSLSKTVPVLMFASLFDASIVGYYTLCKTVLTIPSTLISRSISTVFYPKSIEMVRNKENIFQFLIKAVVYLGLVGVLPFLLLILFGPQLFVWVFGNDWVVAGQFSQWLAIWMFFSFINPPCATLLITLRLQHIELILNIIGFCLRLLAILIGSYIYNSVFVAIALFSIVGVGVQMFVTVYALIKAKSLGARDETSFG